MYAISARGRGFHLEGGQEVTLSGRFPILQTNDAMQGENESDTRT